MISIKHGLYIQLLIFILLLPVAVAGTDLQIEELNLQLEKLNLQSEKTVIITNTIDSRFCRDYSTLLKYLSCTWVEISEATIQPDIRENDLIIIGGINDPWTGGLLHNILSAEQIDILKQQSAKDSILIIPNPWKENQSIIICSGRSLLQKRDAAETLLRRILSIFPPASDWLQSRFDAPFDASLREYIASLQYSFADTELPLEDLVMDTSIKAPDKIPATAAAEDIEHLFYLFSHGYSGYAFFNNNNAFETAKNRILQELKNRPIWPVTALSELIYRELQFISDTHISIGGNKLSVHNDYWYDRTLEFNLTNSNSNSKFDYDYDRDYNYSYFLKGRNYTLLSVNGTDPELYLFPSLNAKGGAIYRLGTVTVKEPAALQLTVINEGEEKQVFIDLEQSKFSYFSNDIFREDTVGGIPVIRIRSFGDSNTAALSEFIQTAAAYRDAPVVILDIRGNGGGNERWPVDWIKNLTGRRAEAVFIRSELESKTSMTGRANAFNYWFNDQNVSAYSREVSRYNEIIKAFESGDRQPGWSSAVYPGLSLIPNDTTIVVITNDLVASAGEGLLMRISQLENVVIVGENSMGALAFGNISAHILPNSRLWIWMPVNFGIFLDQQFREGLGIFPDIWVPAADAVNYVAAALFSGTISTYRPLTEDMMLQNFIPERSVFGNNRELKKHAIIIAIYAVFGIIFGFSLHKRPRKLIVYAIVVIVIGSILIILKKADIGFGILAMGASYLLWAGYGFLKKR
jgi:hypothetical protein